MKIKRKQQIILIVVIIVLVIAITAVTVTMIKSKSKETSAKNITELNEIEEENILTVNMEQNTEEDEIVLAECFTAIDKFKENKFQCLFLFEGASRFKHIANQITS